VRFRGGRGLACLPVSRPGDPGQQQRRIERVGVSGRPGDVAAELAALAAAGAGLILLNPLFDEAEQMERLAAEVIPQLA
jgi:alkanesulfonate monooxygenase SsuD/methylene tetrahydromethanopterin reductase-like flavin-dependent oxidoreductase (luciferase family)